MAPTLTCISHTGHGLRDAAAEAIADDDRTRARLAAEGQPTVSAHLILGARFKEMTRNAARNVEEGRTVPIEIVCRRR